MNDICHFLIFMCLRKLQSPTNFTFEDLIFKCLSYSQDGITSKMQLWQLKFQIVSNFSHFYPRPLWWFSVMLTFFIYSQIVSLEEFANATLDKKKTSWREEFDIPWYGISQFRGWNVNGCCITDLNLENVAVNGLG